MVRLPPQPSKGLSVYSTFAHLMALYFTCVKPSSDSQTLAPIEVTPVPMVNVPLKLWHQPKALSPIVVTELGMVSEPSKPSQLLKAQLPIVVTELPRVKLVKLSQA